MTLNQLKKILQDASEAYPQMEPSDFVKLIFQGANGPGHMISDEQESFDRLLLEYQSATPTGRLFDPVSDRLIRLHLGNVKREYPRLSPNTLNRFFFLTANQYKPNARLLQQRLQILNKLSEQGELPVNSTELKAYLSNYQSAGCPPVSHSETYRAFYHPAYRVIDRQFLLFLPLFEAIDRALENRAFVNVGVDGRCGSGKSTLGVMLRDVYGGNLISADDFFLPKELRTTERLSAPGGNIHYERFLKELSPLKENQSLFYRVFDCSTMNYAETVAVLPKPVNIIEGSYCLRPDFQHLYNLKVFLTVNQAEQRRRISKRNGEDILKVFVDRWIPMEEAYFEKFQIQSAADFVFDTGKK